jgi:hypothetical protein
MALASVVCVSMEILPKLIAPVAKRLTILAAGSTFILIISKIKTYNIWVGNFLFLIPVKFNKKSVNFKYI